MSGTSLSPQTKKTLLKALYVGNLLWHTSAFYHFAFKGAYMMKKLSLRGKSKDSSIAASPQGDEWHHDIMAYLGYINVGFAALAGLRLADTPFIASQAGPSSVLSQLDVLALTVLGIANGSQAWGNFVRSRSSSRWIMGKGYDRITVLDAAFLVLDLAVVGAHFL